MENNLPNLAIIPTNRAILHEDSDAKRVAKLKARYRLENVMLNPVLVAPLKNGNYVVLDGANRVTAFRDLGIPHVLVQVVEYTASLVKLETWNHLICDPKFKKNYAKNIKSFRSNEIEEMLKFVSIYKKRFKFYRVVDRDFAKLKREYPSAVCLIRFHKFQLRDIIKLATNNQKIPSGITRHIVQGRALRLHFPLSILESKISLAQKNRWLKKYISDKIMRSKIRYYQEPVYLFDE